MTVYNLGNDLHDLSQTRFVNIPDQVQFFSYKSRELRMFRSMK